VSVALLVATLALILAGTILFAMGLRRRNSLHGLAAMSMLTASAIPAVAYASITGGI
jgi:hypothetical protein